MADLPEPLVAAEVDLTDFQYMELDVRKLRDSRFAAQVSGDAFRAGVLLWCACWHQVPAGSLPDDDIELANLCGYGRFVKEWRKVREEALHQFVKCSDGRLYHSTVSVKANQAWTAKLKHHYDRACDRLRKANKAAKEKGLPEAGILPFDQWNERRLGGGIPMESADASAGIPKNHPQEESGIPPEIALKGRRNGEGEGEGDFILVGAAAVPPAPPPPAAAAAPASDPPKSQPRGARLSPDWHLPKPWGEWAVSELRLPEAAVRSEAVKFRDFWVAKAGKDATKLDWEATWRNWCRNAKPGTAAAVTNDVFAGAR